MSHCPLSACYMLPVPRRGGAAPASGPLIESIALVGRGLVFHLKAGGGLVTVHFDWIYDPQLGNA